MIIIEATKPTTTLTDKETSYVHSLETHSDEILDLYEDYNTSANTLYNRIREIVINTNDKPYLNDILNLCNKEHHEYYVQMMVAWLLSVAYVYFKDEVLKLLINNQLDNFTYNKTLSKICDSYRITKEEKQIIKSMRR